MHCLETIKYLNSPDGLKLKEKRMDNYTATGIAEGWIESDSEEQFLQAWQHLVDTGLAWSLQGWVGITAKALINAGLIQENK